MQDLFSTLLRDSSDMLPVFQFFKLILCYFHFLDDFSRVILSTYNNEDRSDYINASYINVSFCIEISNLYAVKFYINYCLQGYKRPSCYIAAKGPLPNTESDFWCMI